jgi:hypothetical protein
MFGKRRHKKYMELVRNIKKVESLKCVAECMEAPDKYKDGFSDALELALAIILDRETELYLKISDAPADEPARGMKNKAVVV